MVKRNRLRPGRDVPERDGGRIGTARTPRSGTDASPLAGPIMQPVIGALRRLLHRRFAHLGLLGALALTMTWWFIVARGVWWAIEWATA